MHHIPPVAPQFEPPGASFTHWQSPPSQRRPSPDGRLDSRVHEGTGHPLELSALVFSAVTYRNVLSRATTQRRHCQWHRPNFEQLSKCELL